MPLNSQYNTAGDIPTLMFQSHESIYGRVVRVADGDTFRVRYVICSNVVNVVCENED